MRFLEFHPLLKCRIPSGPSGRDTGSRRWIDELPIDWLGAVAVAIEPNQVPRAVYGGEFEKEEVARAIDKSPELLVDPMLDLL